MLPQDTRAPMLQQRWIECTNVGAAPLAAYSVAEITGSVRPDIAGLTIGGGRTVLQVQVATQNSPEATCVIGPMAVPVAGYGICTLDDPCFALWTSGAVGATVGVASGSSSLTTGNTGYTILGDVAGGLARVMRTRKANYCMWNTWTNAGGGAWVLPSGFTVKKTFEPIATVVHPQWSIVTGYKLECSETGYYPITCSILSRTVTGAGGSMKFYAEAVSADPVSFDDAKLAAGMTLTNWWYSATNPWQSLSYTSMLSITAGQYLAGVFYYYGPPVSFDVGTCSALLKVTLGPRVA